MIMLSCVVLSSPRPRQNELERIVHDPVLFTSDSVLFSCAHVITFFRCIHMGDVCARRRCR